MDLEAGADLEAEADIKIMVLQQVNSVSAFC